MKNFLRYAFVLMACIFFTRATDAQTSVENSEPRNHSINKSLTHTRTPPNLVPSFRSANGKELITCGPTDRTCYVGTLSITSPTTITLQEVTTEATFLITDQTPKIIDFNPGNTKNRGPSKVLASNAWKFQVTQTFENLRGKNIAVELSSNILPPAGMILEVRITHLLIDDHLIVINPPFTTTIVQQKSPP